MRTKYKQWAVDYLGEHPEIVMEKFDINNEFFANGKLCFEIGSGKGEFITMFSKKHLSDKFLAVERCKTVAGIMSKRLVDDKVSNVRVFPNDAKLIFDGIKQGRIDEIYLNFVDPWPKKRHEKRRLTHISFLNEYYRILKNSGQVIFKSDNDSLYEFTLEEIQKTKFKLVRNDEKYEFDETNDSMTEYEKKFRDKGKSIHRIVLEK